MKRKRHKARSVWIDITFSAAIVLLTLSAIFLVFMTENGHTASQSEKETKSSSPLETEQIDSNYPGIKIVTKTSNDKNAPFAIQYPQSIHSSFNSEVKNYIDEVQVRYLDTLTKKKQQDKKTTGELNISYETLPHASGNYSFVLVTSSRYSDTDTGKTEIRSFHLNPETGESFTIRDLFEDDSDRLQSLSSLVRAEILKDESLKGHLIQKDMERFTEPRWMNYRNFSVTDDALIFYFDENTIANNIVGPPIIAVSIDAVKELLATTFKPEDKEETVDIVDKDKGEEIAEENIEENSTDPSSETEVSKENDETETTLPETSLRKKVALTFDDGPDPKVTRQILNTLQKHDAKATFFMLGSRVEYYPDIVNEMMEAGHELGNHTWTHADLTKLGPDRVAKEIEKTSAIIEEVTGQKVEAFRPPYGAVNDAVHNMTGLPIILWDVDTLDWKYRDSARILQVVKENVKDGSIILMHDIHQSTADGLDAVLTYLSNEGYDFVTVKELEETSS